MAVIQACSGVYIDGSRYSVYTTVGVATTVAVFVGSASHGTADPACPLHQPRRLPVALRRRGSNEPAELRQLPVPRQWRQQGGDHAVWHTGGATGEHTAAITLPVDDTTSLPLLAAGARAHDSEIRSPARTEVDDQTKDLVARRARDSDSLSMELLGRAPEAARNRPVPRCAVPCTPWSPAPVPR